MPDDIPDRGSGRYENGKPVTAESKWQPVENMSWPRRDKDGWHARGIDDVAVEQQIAVMVRVEFERDGEVWLRGTADRWFGRCVHVSVDDVRLQVGGVWVGAEDVRRV